MVHGVATDSNGLYHMRARYYNPEIKRFINRDVLTGSISDSQTLNRYAYVNGNPISYVDPFGLSRDGDSAWLQGGSFLADLVPWVGTVKGFQQAFTGNNYITGEHLSAGDRWGEGIGATLSIIPIPGLKHAGKYGTKGVIWAGSKLKNIFGEGTVKTTKKLIYECNCFTAGTKVLTDEGEKPIEEIEVGDKVLSKDDETGEVAYKEVVGLFQKQADEIYYVHIGDEIIEVTGEHPFWLDGKGWTFVKDLKVGDLLVSSDGTKLAIDKIEKESREATVYNFEVEDFNSYFVSNLGIWVHNCAINGNPVPTKSGGGSNPSDFVNPHSEKHLFDSTRPSTKNRSQYGQDVDVGKLRQETMTNPDKAYSNWPNPNNPNNQRITKYYKEFDGNISTPDTPTGSHRVFENLDDPTRSSHFPYVSRK